MQVGNRNFGLLQSVLLILSLLHACQVTGTVAFEAGIMIEATVLWIVCHIIAHYCNQFGWKCQILHSFEILDSSERS